MIKRAKPRKSRPSNYLARLFEEGGYLRAPDPKRQKKLGREYHKGYEVRLVVSARSEITSVKRCLGALGLKPGRAFEKGSRWVIPIYGKESQERFLKSIGHRGNARRKK
jgi:hypothetical protein